MLRDFVTNFLGVLLFFLGFFVGGGTVILGSLLVYHAVVTGSWIFALAAVAYLTGVAAVIALSIGLADRL